MALLRFAESIQKAEGRYPALEAVLKREPPRIRGLSAGARVHTIDLDEIRSRTLGLDSSYLFIQGPPGAGKTWAGARLIVHLLRIGRRVGVAAQSHKAIHNLLNEFEKVSRETDFRFRGLKKSSNSAESVYEGEFITSESQMARIVEAADRVKLLAGTAWLFSRDELDGRLDYLVIDEAGQVSLADSLAMATSARNLILLGDPLQLAQVSQGLHPPGSGASVLEHLLGAAPTIPERPRDSFSRRVIECIRMSANSSRRSFTRDGSTLTSRLFGGRPYPGRASASFPWNTRGIVLLPTRR
jgi:uncharacterized protein